jgi:hypothetical protein
VSVDVLHLLHSSADHLVFTMACVCRCSDPHNLLALIVSRSAEAIPSEEISVGALALPLVSDCATISDHAIFPHHKITALSNLFFPFTQLTD